MFVHTHEINSVNYSTYIFSCSCHRPYHGKINDSTSILILFAIDKKKKGQTNKSLYNFVIVHVKVSVDWTLADLVSLIQHIIINKYCLIAQSK